MKANLKIHRLVEDMVWGMWWSDGQVEKHMDPDVFRQVYYGVRREVGDQTIWGMGDLVMDQVKLDYEGDT